MQAWGRESGCSGRNLGTALCFNEPSILQDVQNGFVLFLYLFKMCFDNFSKKIQLRNKKIKNKKIIIIKKKSSI